MFSFASAIFGRWFDSAPRKRQDQEKTQILRTDQERHSAVQKHGEDYVAYMEKLALARQKIYHGQIQSTYCLGSTASALNAIALEEANAEFEGLIANPVESKFNPSKV